MTRAALPTLLLALSALLTPPALLALSVTSAAAAPVTGPVPLGTEWPLDAQHFDAVKVWRLSRGAGVTVAVVDSGVSARHPDLAGRVLPGTDITHQAADGRIDIAADSHGTSVAGVVAATGTAPHGMVGLAPASVILPVRISGDGTSDPLALAQGIVYAARHGAGVINISMTTQVADPQLRDAVAYAVAHDIVVVAAAGNNGRAGNQITYPAGFPGVVAVSGTTRDGSFWPLSESGSYISVAAPADGIYSTKNSGGYLTADGTSYSAPYVSATAALLRAAFPSESAGQIIARLIGTADRPPGAPGAHGHDDRLGYGLINPLKALRASAPPARTNPLLTAGPPAAKPATRSGATPWAAGGIAAGTAAVATGGFAVFRRRRRSAS
ncbi:S8 family serine peptidase [Streptomyces sp. NPDC047042]|uniref:S8 family serine peptidase n=1 Tax=Streptomyces sp. NPDC047042 TaxID=3154807 RepID=UPI0033E25E73